MREVRLEDICELNMGKTPLRNESSYWGEGHVWISISDMKEKILMTSKEQITDLGVKKSGIKLVKAGTLLMSFKLSIGKLGFAGVNLYTNEAIVALPLKPGAEIYPEYLYYALKYVPLTEGVNQAAKGMTLNKKSLAEIKVPVPDKYEDQIRIATILSKVESMIEKRKESIGLLDEFLASSYLAICGKNAEGYKYWDEVLVESLALDRKGSMRTGPFGSKLKHSEFVEQGIAVLGIDNAVHNEFRWNERRYITKEKYKELKSYTIYPEDVIVTIMGTVGRTAVVPKDIPLSINTKHLAAISCDQSKCLPEYLSKSFLFNPDVIAQVKQKSKGAIMDGLNLTIIRGLKLRKAPIINQKKYVNIVDKIRFIKANYTESLTQLEKLFSVVSFKAFSGDLDLSEIDIGKSSSVLNYSKSEVVTPVINPIDMKVKKYSKENLRQFLLKREEHFVSYTEIKKELQNFFKSEMPDVEVLKKELLTMLEEKNPILQQVYDYSTDDRKKSVEKKRNVEKKIVFKVNNEN